MKGDKVDSTTPPPVMQLRRSTRKSRLREGFSSDAPEVAATKDFGHSSANQERHVHETLCMETLDSLPKLGRSTRKSRRNQTEKNECSEDVDTLERDEHLSLLPSENNSVAHGDFVKKEGVHDGWINGEQEELLSSPRVLRSGLMIGLRGNEGDFVAALTPHLQKSIRKSRLPKSPNVQVESEDRVTNYSGNVDPMEEMEGDKQMSSVVSTTNSVSAAINEQEEKEVSWKEVTTKVDDQAQAKTVEDSGDRQIIEEEQVSQRVSSTNSEDWVQQNCGVFDNQCRQEGTLLEIYEKCDRMKDHIEETDEDDEQMADLVSKHLLSHFSQKSMPRTQSAMPSFKVSWSPRYGLPFLDDKKPLDKKGCYEQGHTSLRHKLPLKSLGPDGNLQDGLFVPPNDVRKLKKFAKQQVVDTAGDKWFNMPAPTLTPELRKELQLLKLRSVIDPKRHYKAQDSKTLPKYFQIGTVVEGPADYYSGRLTRKERKSTFADELLSDSGLARYRKRKYSELQDMKEAGGKKSWKKKKNRQKPSWARV